MRPKITITRIPRVQAQVYDQNLPLVLLPPPTVAVLELGIEGRPGPAGVGVPGLSAYQIWLAAGNSGSEAVFLASLQGADGADGAGLPAVSADLTIPAMTSHHAEVLAAPGAVAGQAIRVWLSGDQPGATEADEIWAAPAHVTARCLVAGQIEVRLASPLTRFRGTRRITYQLI